MEKRKLNLVTTLFVGVLFLSGFVFFGVKQQKNTEKSALQVINELIEEQSEKELEIEDWMVDFDVWNKSEKKLLEPITLKAEVSEENFSLINKRFVNLLAVEEEEDIELEAWMLSSKKLIKRM